MDHDPRDRVAKNLAGLIRRFFYGGLGRRKSSLALIWQSLMCVSLISFQVPISPCTRHLVPSFVLGSFVVVLLGLFINLFAFCLGLHWEFEQLWTA
jgi:hypothetical protein